MSKKWYNYIVSVDDDAAQQAQNRPGTPASSKSAAQSVAEIASTIAPEPQFTTPVSDPTSLKRSIGLLKFLRRRRDIRFSKCRKCWKASTSAICRRM